MTAATSTIKDNSAVTGGGIGNGDTLTVSNSTLSGNSAFFGGGISSFLGGTLTVENSTLYDNSANNWGGGISNFGEMTVSNSLVSGNNSGNKNIHVGHEVRNDPLHGKYTTSHNLFGHDGENEADAFFGFTPGKDDIVATRDNTSDATHIETLLGHILNTTLADNGGPTETHILVKDSPAIDVGECDDGNDQRGFPRPVDLNNNPSPGGSGCDIGAVELQYGPTAVSLQDFAAESGGGGLAGLAAGVLAAVGVGAASGRRLRGRRR